MVMYILSGNVLKYNFALMKAENPTPVSFIGSGLSLNSQFCLASHTGPPPTSNENLLVTECSILNGISPLSGS